MSETTPTPGDEEFARWAQEVNSLETSGELVAVTLPDGRNVLMGCEAAKARVEALRDACDALAQQFHDLVMSAQAAGRPLEPDTYNAIRAMVITLQQMAYPDTEPGSIEDAAAHYDNDPHFRAVVDGTAAQGITDADIDWDNFPEVVPPTS